MTVPTTKSQCAALRLGPLDVSLVNRTLGTELEPGDLYLSRQAHWHIAKDHAEDYAACMAALRRIGQSPGLIGQAPKHADNFELVIRFRSNRSECDYVLIAVGLEQDQDGLYRVKSAYRLHRDNRYKTASHRSSLSSKTHIKKDRSSRSFFVRAGCNPRSLGSNPSPLL